MKNIYSVGQVNRYVKNMFTQDFVLQKVYVKGEVSNCKYHPSGHIYFSLKDETGVLSCVMFAGQRRGLAFRMKNGDKVVAGGSVDVYERDGRYQLYAREITLEGAGALYERFLALKEELEEMGMFAQEYKQPIPHIYPQTGCSDSTCRSCSTGHPQYFPETESVSSDYSCIPHWFRAKVLRTVLSRVSECWIRPAWM